MQETAYADTLMIVVAQASGPSISRRTGNSKIEQQTNKLPPPVRKELQPGCNSTQEVSRSLFLGLPQGGGLAFVYNVYLHINYWRQQQSAFRISVCALPHKPTKTAKGDVLELECPFGIESSSCIESPEVFPDLDHLVDSSHAGQMRVVARTNQRMATSQ
jgi:hypothetical protein